MLYNIGQTCIFINNKEFNICITKSQWIIIYKYVQKHAYLTYILKMIFIFEHNTKFVLDIITRFKYNCTNGPLSRGWNIQEFYWNLRWLDSTSTNLTRITWFISVIRYIVRILLRGKFVLIIRLILHYIINIMSLYNAQIIRLCL